MARSKSKKKVSNDAKVTNNADAKVDTEGRHRGSAR